MAFTKIENWSCEGPGAKGIAPERIFAPALFTDFTRGEPIRKGLGIIAASVIHVVAVVLLFSRLGGVPTTQAQGAPSELTLIDLDKGDQESSEQEEQVAISIAEKPVEPVQAAPVSKPEWSAVRMVMLQAIQPVTGSATPATPAGAAGQAGGGYDPYAGAAPENLDRLLAQSAGRKPSPGVQAANTRLIEFLRRKMRQIDPAINFPISAQLTLSSDGRILDCRLVGAGAPARLSNTASRLRGTTIPPELLAVDVAHAQQIDLQL